MLLSIWGIGDVEENDKLIYRNYCKMYDIYLEDFTFVSRYIQFLNSSTSHLLFSPHLTSYQY